MRRTMRLTRGAVFAATLALPALRAGAQDGPMPAWPYSNTQETTGPIPGGASSQTGLAPGKAAEAAPPGTPGTPGMPGAAPGTPGTPPMPGAAPVGPDGTPLSTPGAEANSGAFA